MTGVNANPALNRHIDAYLAHGRALGRRYRQEAWLLGTMLRDLPVLGHDDLTAQSYAMWFEARKDRHPNTRRKWAEMLRRFCLFRRRWLPECFVPGPEQACNRRPYVTPAIVGDEDIAQGGGSGRGGGGRGGGGFVGGGGRGGGCSTGDGKKKS